MQIRSGKSITRPEGLLIYLFFFIKIIKGLWNVSQVLFKWIPGYKWAVELRLSWDDIACWTAGNHPVTGQELRGIAAVAHVASELVATGSRCSSWFFMANLLCW